jgi:transposase-like protein
MGHKQYESAESRWRDRLGRFSRGKKQSVKEFCRREGVSEASFYQWRKRLGGRAHAGSRRSTPIRRERKCQNGFVPVKVAAAPVAEVALPSGVVVRVPATNVEALRVAIAAGDEVCREVT